MNMLKMAAIAFGFGMVLSGHAAVAGPLDPDCTAEKAAKSAATKAAVGVGGRCSPAEAAKDTTKKAVGVEDKGPVDKLKDDKTPVTAPVKQIAKPVTGN